MGPNHKTLWLDKPPFIVEKTLFIVNLPMKNGDNFHGIVIQWDINGITLWLCQNSY